MKKLDIVKLINDNPYLNNNLKNNMRGVVLSDGVKEVSVLFFNPYNMGDYAVVDVDIADIVLEKENLPSEIKKEILLNIDSILTKPKTFLENVQIKDYDMVELIVEDSKYSKFGVHKGDRGCVMDANAIQNYIEVDFSKMSDNGDICGECISVKIEDLKVINN